MGKLGVIQRNGDKGIFDNLRPVLAIFRLWLALKHPKGPQWFPMDNLVCHKKSR